MKKLFLTAVLLLAVFGAVPAHADSGDNPFSLGFKAALVLPTKDSSAGLESDYGFQLGLTGLYRIRPYLRVGGQAEWEWYDINQSGTGIKAGTVHTISLLPVAELRYIEEDLPVSPYLIGGLGANLNYFKEGAALAGVSVDLDPTLCFKIAGGLDIFASETFIIRTEAGWKMNRGELTANPPGTKADFDASNVSFTLGFGFRV